MNLQTLLPSLTGDVHHALEAAGITTAEDLILIPDAQLSQQFPDSAIPITELKAQVAALVSATAARGDELFNREETRESTREACLCGVDELDGLLGGFGQYGVIEIAGGKRSGKTVSCLEHLLVCSPTV